MSIVIGLGFGDEGKGLTTSFLCSQTKNPLVVRFNGGHQAGHTVVHEGKRHVFSSFGSGSLQGVPTYWSKYCTFEPVAFMNEYKLLNEPIIFVDPLCPVTTPMDIAYSQDRESIKRHGSVGVGFGATIGRQESNHRLFVQDLFYPSVLKTKLNAILDYYGYDEDQINLSYFLNAIKEIEDVIVVRGSKYLLNGNTIFEGAQGILLDQDFGFFPNVTRSNTTCKNVARLALYDTPPIYYVTRSYLTRHGNGFLPGEQKLELRNNENETNTTHEFQGEFRTAPLNVDLLNYALACDSHFTAGRKKNLVVTCIDQYPIDVNELLQKIYQDFDKVYVSKGPSLTDISQFR